MKDRKKRNLAIGMLCCMLVFMGVGFAILNSTLNINGTATAVNTWNIVIDSITPIDNDTAATSVSTEIKASRAEASFAVDFTKPGDYLEYEVIVSNEGSIGGYLESVKLEFENPENTDNSLFKITNDAEEGAAINAGESISFKVRVEYDSEADRMPTSSVNFNLYTNVVQKLEQGEVVTPVNVCEEGEINLAGECFHIMSEDDTTYTLLAKYNLLVGNNVVGQNFQPQLITPIDPNTPGYGLQNVKARGVVSGASEWVGTIDFADSGYWHDMTNNTLLDSYGTSYPTEVYDSNSKLYQYVENYELYLKNNGYLSVTGRLMTLAEARNLGCSEKEMSCETAPTWVYSTTYWIGSAYFKNGLHCIVSLGALGEQNVDYEGLIGVRPVITILKSEV